MPTAYIGIGSNLGKKRDNCRKAIEMMAKEGLSIRALSSFYEMEPWGVKKQPAFVNMALMVETALKPKGLLKTLLRIEDKMGRVRDFMWGPRLIDLDILLYDEMVIEEPELQVPHPLMHERVFVLEPLAEIAPRLRHPVLKKTIKELLIELKAG